MTKTARRLGLTLVEVTIAFVIMIAIAAMMFTLLIRSSSQMESDQVGIALDELGRRSLDQLTRDLRLTKLDQIRNASNITITPNDVTVYPEIRFSIPDREFNLQTYRASGADALLSRTVRVYWAPETGETAANGVDDNKDGMTDDGIVVREETGKNHQTNVVSTTKSILCRNVRKDGFQIKVPNTNKGRVEITLLLDRPDPKHGLKNPKLISKSLSATVDLRN